MRLSTLCMVTLLAAGAVGVADAAPTNLVVNGTFSDTTGQSGTNPAVTVPTQFGTSWSAGQFITGWTGNNGYEIWYPNAHDAMTVNAQGQYTSTGSEKLWQVTNPPNGTLTFVGLDGDQSNGIQSSIGQMLNNLSIGATYTVSFDWGAAQLQSRTGDTTETLQVFFGNQSQTIAPVLNNPSKGFTGWESATFQFVADSTSAFLNFLSIGTPSGLPPMALLTNVSVTKDVPEPSALAMFGGGLLGLGLLVMHARRRELRRREADGSRAVV